METTLLSFCFIYISLIAFMLLIFARAGIRLWVKMVLAVLLVAYGIVLFYVPKSFMGWATTEEPPDGAIVLAYRVIEPGLTSPGYMFVWMEQDAIDTPVPPWLRIFDSPFGKETTVRSYRFPYSKKQHKEMADAQRQGFLLRYRRGKEPRVEAIDPRTLLKKQPQGREQ